MRQGEVIPSKRWQHPDGRTASIYGAPPIGDGWEVVQVGWTIRWDDGTVGLCRQPFKTEEEAHEFLARRG